MNLQGTKSRGASEASSQILDGNGWVTPTDESPVCVTALSFDLGPSLSQRAETAATEVLPFLPICVFVLTVHMYTSVGFHVCVHLLDWHCHPVYYLPQRSQLIGAWWRTM